MERKYSGASMSTQEQSDDDIDEVSHANGDADRVSNVNGDAASDVSSVASSHAKSDVGNRAKSDAGSHAKSDAGSHAKIDADSHAKSDAGSHAKIDADSHAKSDAGSDAKINAGSHAKIAADSHSKINAGSHAKINAGSRAKNDAGSSPDSVSFRRTPGIPLEKALVAWEDRYKVKAYEEENVRIMGWFPPVCLMDSSLARLKRCTRLSLSTNIIGNISNLHYMEHLKILSLGRNQIKSLSGITNVKGTLEELWISHNCIDKLEGMEELTKLKVIYMGYNNVSLWSEVERMVGLKSLKILYFTGNPIEKQQSAIGKWRTEAINRIKSLERLDGVPVFSTKLDAGTKEDLEINSI